MSEKLAVPMNVHKAIIELIDRGFTRYEIIGMTFNGEFSTEPCINTIRNFVQELMSPDHFVEGMVEGYEVLPQPTFSSEIILLLKQHYDFLPSEIIQDIKTIVEKYYNEKF